jgi:hypothetical protein
MKVSPIIAKRWYLFLIPLFLLLVALPAVQVYPYYQPALSAATVEVVGQTAVVKFNLSDGDRENFLAAARKMGFAWDGQDIAVSLGAEASKSFAKYAPLNIGILAPSDKEIILQAEIKDIPRGTPELTGSGAEFIPKDALMSLRSMGISKYYELPGREVFAHTSQTGTLGIIVREGELEFIYVTEISDLPSLEAALASLKDQDVTLGQGYSEEEAVSAGFSEGSFEGVTTYSLSRPDLIFQPTFGIVGGNLLVASSTAAWQMAKTSAEAGETLSTNPRFRETLGKLPIFSIGSAYLDLEKLSSSLESLLAAVDPFAKVSLGKTGVTSVNFGSLETVGASWFGIENWGDSARVLLRLNLKDE